MNKKEFLKSINNIDDKFLREGEEFFVPEEAEKSVLVYRKKRMSSMSALSVAACCALVIAAAVFIGSIGGNKPVSFSPDSAGTADTENTIETETTDETEKVVDIDLGTSYSDYRTEIEANINKAREELALSLLNCRVNEDGAYYIDQTNLSDDYELFRKYFFGTWEGSFCFPQAPEKKRLVIDDTENSFVMTDTDIKILNGFYETGAHVLAFMTGSSAGPATFWISLDEPDTLYTAWGGTMNSPLWSRNESGEYSNEPVVYILRKTNEPLNEPENDFLSIFKLYEMAKEYGIDPELLVKIKYEIDGTILYHDDWAQLYPMYLVSESDNEIIIRTSVGSVYETEIEPIEVLCTFERTDGEWNRSSVFNPKDGCKNENDSGITLTGKCLSQDQLVSFEPDYEWARTYIDNWYVSDFLNGLNDPEFKELYCKALTLIRLVSTNNLTPADAVLAQGDERAKLQLDGEGGFYLESGYTVDSFQKAYYSVFTKETADIILSAHSAFYSYGGELWYKSISAGGDMGEIFQEYELINQTDTELEFKRISYSVAIGEPITDYDPSKKDEYEKSEVEFRFVKTADGWRAEKFLNATVTDQTMLIA